MLFSFFFLQYLQPNGNNWRWFDDRSGRWCSYSASNNSTIDSAWWAGESSVRFTAGRRRYTVQFNTMVQVCSVTVATTPVSSSSRASSCWLVIPPPPLMERLVFLTTAR